MPEKSSFQWLPGQGPAPLALHRMAEAFPKPRKPMGEAWFMGERQMFPELLGNLDELTNEQIWRPLEELTSGPSCFGHHEEWTEWYHYLLPRLMTHRWRRTGYDPTGLLISGFIAHHPDSGGPTQYSSLLTDAVATLGRYAMSSKFWTNGEVKIELSLLHKEQRVGGIREWYDCGGILSASLFFCLKYLPELEVGPWYESVVAIDDPYWIEQIIVWLIGAYPILTSVNAQPANLPEIGPYCVAWDWSHVLTGNYTGDFQGPLASVSFLPTANCEALVEVARNWAVDKYFENLLTDPELEGLIAEVPGLPTDFRRLYG